MSDYQSQIIEDNNYNSHGKNKKLIPNKDNKKIQTSLSKIQTLFNCRASIKKKFIEY